MLQSTQDFYKAASRMKKAVACLLWISDMPLETIESILTKHGGKWDGVAGPVRRISERTHDILSVTAAVTEYLHPGLDLSDGVAKLFTRLEIGISSSVVDFGKIIGTQFTRGDYRSLINSGLISINAVDASNDKTILDVLGGNPEKLLLLNSAVQRLKEQREERESVHPLIPSYQP
jgi:hypothetical protein